MPDRNGKRTDAGLTTPAIPTLPAFSSIPVIHRPSAGAFLFVVEPGIVHLREIQQFRYRHIQSAGQPVQRPQLWVPRLPDTTSSTVLRVMHLNQEVAYPKRLIEY